MSSLYGLWQWPLRASLREDAAGMASALAVYGPDRQFSRLGEGLVLGGNLSAFLPEDRFDRQPILTPDGQSWLVADLRLDNRDELTRGLDLTHVFNLKHYEN